MDERVKSLPVWAQKYIEELELELFQAKKSNVNLMKAFGEKQVRVRGLLRKAKNQCGSITSPVYKLIEQALNWIG